MLDPWIIEEIRRREDQRRERDACQIELPLPDEPIEHVEDATSEQDKPKRGVVTMDM